MFRFLQLPRELRDAIYYYYVSVDGGYAFNFETGKLASSTRDRQLDLSLTKVCKQIAKEMEGLALQHNTITFSTTDIASDELRIRAARFKYLRWWFSGAIARTLVENSFTEAAAGEMLRSYPTMAPLVRSHLDDSRSRKRTPFKIIRNHGNDLYHSWGLPRSLHRQALKQTLQITLDRGEFYLAKGLAQFGFPGAQQLLALDSEFPAWSIPTEDGLARLISMLSPHPEWHPKATREYWERGPHRLPDVGLHHNRYLDDRIQYTQGLYRFSAAAVAIQFLSSFPNHLLKHLRCIRLLEDRVAVAWPESHGQGLIQFCIDNPRLRIERRLDLWRNVFQSYIPLEMHESPEEFRANHESSLLSSVDATDRLAIWLDEALALESTGMPKGSFSLVLDAGPAPELASEIFGDIIQRDAAWQNAWEMFCAENEKRFDTKDEGINFFMRDARRSTAYISEGFPQAISDIVHRTSNIIRCTFNPGLQLWDTPTEFKKYRTLKLEQWDDLRCEHRVNFETRLPLPAWSELLAENIMPEYFKVDWHNIPHFADPWIFNPDEFKLDWTRAIYHDFDGRRWLEGEDPDGDEGDKGDEGEGGDIDEKDFWNFAGATGLTALGIDGSVDETNEAEKSTAFIEGLCQLYDDKDSSLFFPSWDPDPDPDGKKLVRRVKRWMRDQQLGGGDPYSEWDIANCDCADVYWTRREVYLRRKDEDYP